MTGHTPTIVERLRAYALDWRDRAASKEVVDEAADTIEEMGSVLQDVRAYDKGDERFNFSALGNIDRENASYDAWQEIATRIDDVLAKATGAA
jgi:hypothetical protein